MNTDKPNKIPRKKTIASHFSQGKFCDYPADAIFDAVNSYNYEYNSITIPIRLGFLQTFNLNFRAFAYLSIHRSEEVFTAFLADPDGFMDGAGVQLPAPFDDITPKIMIAMLEDELYEAIMSDDCLAVYRLVDSSKQNSWTIRHPERYPSSFMNRSIIYGLSNDSILTGEYIASFGFPHILAVQILHIRDYFTE